MKKIFIWVIATVAYLILYGLYVNHLGDLYFDNIISEGKLIFMVGILLVPAWFGIREIVKAISDNIKSKEKSIK